MAYQAKTEPLEAFSLGTVNDVFTAFNLLYGMGYRGTLTTVNGGGARIDLSMADAVSIAAAVGDVILYRASGPTVVKCLTAEAFAAGYVPI